MLLPTVGQTVKMKYDYIRKNGKRLVLIFKLNRMVIFAISVLSGLSGLMILHGDQPLASVLYFVLSFAAVVLASRLTEKIKSIPRMTGSLIFELEKVDKEIRSGVPLTQEQIIERIKNAAKELQNE